MKLGIDMAVSGISSGSASYDPNKKIEAERELSEAELAKMKEVHQARLAALKSQEAETYDRFSEDNAKRVEELRERSHQAASTSEETVQQQLQALREKNREIFESLEKRTSEQLAAVQRGRSEQLNAYSARKEDPFYRFVDLKASLSESDSQYQVSAQVPFHEQKGMSASMQGKHLVISGTRKNEDRIEDPGIGYKSTASFQTFHQAFLLPWPVDSKQLRMHFEGEKLVVSVPKIQPESQGYEVYTPQKRVERVQIQRPKFPDDLVTIPRQKSSETLT